MRHNWQHLSLLLASEAVIAQRVLQASVQHFQSEKAGPWEPLIALGYGSPPQEITGIFDSGSSDLIIPQAGSAVCKVKNQQCTAPKLGRREEAPEQAPELEDRGQFDPKQASDVKKLKGTKFDASFGNGDRYTGGFIKTTVSIGDKGGVPGAQVALASGGQPAGDFPQFSIVGVGPRGNEATEKQYDNLPQVMKTAGAINGNVYSCVMNPKPFANGSVFFGGIDRSKFDGELQQVKLDPAKDEDGNIIGFNEFVVKMSSLKLDMSGGDQGAQPNKAQQRERMRLKRSIEGHKTVRRVGIKAKGIYGGGQVRTESVEAENDEPVNVLNNGKGNGKNNGKNSGQNKKNNGKNNGRNSGQNKKNNRKNNDKNNCKNNDQGDGSRNNNDKDGNDGADNENENGDKNGGNLIDLPINKDDTFALFDTGGVDLTLPPDVVKDMAKALDTEFREKSSNLGPVECGKLNAGNKLVMGFNDDGVQMTMGLDKLRLSEELTDPKLTEAGMCQVGVTAGDQDNNLSSIGFVFFTDVYTVFDLESNSLWFAQAKGDPGATGGQLEEFPPSKGA
ncbi:hypothetical protein MY4038_009317 [Beauveria bassiana]